jgi:hypothetical protein
MSRLSLNTAPALCYGQGFNAFRIERLTTTVHENLHAPHEQVEPNSLNFINVKMCQTQVVKKNVTHISCPIQFLHTSYGF